MKTLYIIYTFIILLYSTYSFSQAGSFDPSFGGGGHVRTTYFGNQHCQGNSIVIQEDGKLIVSGASNAPDGLEYAILSRYLPDGTIDNSFNGNGKIIVPVDGYSSSSNSVIVQPDGKILMLVGAYNDQEEKLAIFRFLADGLPDNSFGGDGSVVTSLNADHLDVRAITLQPDGKILVGGYVGYDPDNFYRCMVIRYLPDGTLDNSFDGDGIDTIRVGQNYSNVRSLIVQPDNKIIAIGYGVFNDNDDYAVVRFNSNGSVDHSFGEEGIAHVSYGTADDRCTGGVRQSDGKIVVGGYTQYYVTGEYAFSAARFNGDGTIDKSFHGDGMTLINLSSHSDVAHSIILQPDGKIVLCGYAHADFPGNSDMALVRLNANGIPDFTFDDDGIAIYEDNADTSSILRSIALQPDGKIVGTGISRVSEFNGILVARFLSGLIVGTADEYVSSMNISFFPNPVSDKVNVDYKLDRKEKIAINLYDMQGRIVQQLLPLSERNTGQHLEELTIRRPLPPGNYIINMESRSWNHSMKIMID